MNRQDYLEQLAKKLRRSLPEPLIQERIRELDSHLKMSTADGVSEDEAVKNLGSIEVVSSELIRQQRGYNVLSAWKLARWVGPVVFLGVFLPYARLTYFVMHPHLAFDVGGWFMIGGTIAFAVYGLQVWRTRRWLVLPVAAWTSLAILLVCIMTVLCVPSAPSARDRALAGVAINKEIAQLAPNKKAIEQWRNGQAPNGLGPTPMSTIVSVQRPLLPFAIKSEAVSGFSLFPMTEEDAQQAWRRNGSPFAESIRAQEISLREQLARNSASPRANTAPVAASFWNVARLFVMSTSECTVYLTFWNALVLFLANMASRRQNRRYRRLA